MSREREHVMVIEPELADDDEADQPAQELGGELEQLMGEFADAGMILERRYLELEHEQRHHDGEHAVAESLDAGQAQLALPEAIEQSHRSSPSQLRRLHHRAYGKCGKA
jgi:hypothetical protein